MLKSGVLFNGHSDRVWSCSFSSDGLRIVSAGRDMTVRVWSAQTHQQIGDPFQGHTDEVFGVRESDGTFVVSSDRIPETIIWDRRSGAIVGDQKQRMPVQLIQSQT